MPAPAPDEVDSNLLPQYRGVSGVQFLPKFVTEDNFALVAGLVFGVAALATAMLHPLYGRLADRLGARRLTLWGLVVSGCVLPLVGRITSFESAVPIFVVQTAALALMIAPSLAYMGEATSIAGLGSFGVAYGLYNVAWGVGLLGGPAIGGVLFERIGLQRLALWWAPAVVLLTAILARVPVGEPAPRSALDSG